MDSNRTALKPDMTDASVPTWQDAPATYEETSGRSIAEANEYSTEIHIVDHLRDVLQETEQKISALRNRHAIWGYLNTALKPLRYLCSLAKLVTKLTQFTPAYTVLSAVLYLLKAVEGPHSQTRINPNLEEILTKLIYVDLEIFAQAERPIKKRNIVEFMSTAFLGKDLEVEYLLVKRNLILEELEAATSNAV
ncbi:uncharacterized protein TRUGW13939_05191 [Talaromyces rugulosus]|uniref:Fungal STAND N-terminal Goodbye domain-containing protein n=1 Tax=Talaromyces rugulosus TaxID=121627 RepID=A0A7H8QVM3_TALRU|nr:uncharacterized protein TRUGW13939_05191 [Talaromyces rugulosus]QKX58070.1 hypothetical protein TRUGW13939_05191 [Talaromyces rugulosus]